MHFFISSEGVDRSPTAPLIERLRHAGWTVNHSPSNPLDGEDPRWQGWYDHGMPVALDAADLFIVVITPGFDCSSWIAWECSVAMQPDIARQVPHSFYWNPEQITVTAAGMLPFMHTRLPDDLDDLVAHFQSTNFPGRARA